MLDEWVINDDNQSLISEESYIDGLITILSNLMSSMQSGQT